mmetsp:Transcript_19447/g.50580  ORF Transcript_19447/g.50580 Transcript_19447/m.50580 type:complete len:250 (+) Transcript_19447:225-974(+)
MRSPPNSSRLGTARSTASSPRCATPRAGSRRSGAVVGGRPRLLLRVSGMSPRCRTNPRCSMRRPPSSKDCRIFSDPATGARCGLRSRVGFDTKRRGSCTRRQKTDTRCNTFYTRRLAWRHPSSLFARVAVESWAHTSPHRLLNLATVSTPRRLSTVAPTRCLCSRWSLPSRCTAGRGWTTPTRASCACFSTCPESALPSAAVASRTQLPWMKTFDKVSPDAVPRLTTPPCAARPTLSALRSSCGPSPRT